MSYFDYPLDSKLEKSIISMNKSAMDSLKSQNFSEAASLLHKSLQILKLSKSSEASFKLRAVTLNNLGILYRSTKDYSKALEFLSSALEVSRNLSTDVINRAGTHLNICAIKSSLNQHEQALQHALTAIQMLGNKKSDFSASLVVAYHSAGIEYQFLNLPLKARSHFEYGFNLAAQKLGKTHPLTLSLEEALQDYYGYKVKSRQKSNDVYLEARKINEERFPRYVPPIDKIYKQEVVVKRPDPTFLSPSKMKKRVFVRIDAESRSSKHESESQLEKREMKIESQLEKRIEIETESQLEKGIEIEEDFEEMISKFREDIKESRLETSRKNLGKVGKSGSFVIEIQLNDQEELAKREVSSSPCVMEETKGIKVEKYERNDSQDFKGDDLIEENENNTDSIQDEIIEMSEDIKEEINIDEEKLKIVKSAISRLDEKVQAFSEDYKKLILEDLNDEKIVELETLNREKQAVLIQKHLRGWISRLKYKRVKQKIIKIQRKWREFRYKKYLKKVKNFKIDFCQQLNESAFIVRPDLVSSEAQTSMKDNPYYKLETKSVLLIEPNDLHRSIHKTITFIQAHIRGFLCRRLRHKLKNSIVKAQSTIRMYQIKKLYLNILHAIVFIQRMYRAYRLRKARKPKKLPIKRPNK